MKGLELFLGLPVEASLLASLKKSRDFERVLSEYLVEVISPIGGSCIGKKIGTSIDIETLRNTEANIYSLLSKLHPDFAFKTIPLLLFPYSP